MTDYFFLLLTACPQPIPAAFNELHLSMPNYALPRFISHLLMLLQELLLYQMARLVYVLP